METIMVIALMRTTGAVRTTRAMAIALAMTTTMTAVPRNPFVEPLDAVQHPARPQ